MKSRKEKTIIVMGIFIVCACFVWAQEQKAETQEAAEVTVIKAKLKADITAKEKEEVSEGVKSFSIDILLPLCTNPVFVKEVKAQNAKKVTLEEIQAIDKQWAEAEDELPIHKEKTENACAKEIQRIVKEIPVLGEVFVMDNQGANVGQNQITSDYWQGDEAKWKNSFNEGKGGLDISEMKLDKSSNKVDQKVSLPVIDETGAVIGAVCYGIDKTYADLIGKISQDIDAAQNASDPVKAFAKACLLPLSMNSIFTKDVETQNGKNMTLDDIKKIDEEWTKAEDELPIHAEKLGSPSGKELTKIVKANPVLVEAFVMDMQGANVGQNVLTSDFWQGDEAKWQNSYKEGKGGVDISDVKLDKSTNIQLQQISLPVIDKNGKVIGAVCYGLKVEELKNTRFASAKQGS